MNEATDRELVVAPEPGDERAFATLIDDLGSSLLRVSMGYVLSRAVAEEVVQENWLGVVRGPDRFEGRSSLKTWIFWILTKTAVTHGARERHVPFSSLADDDGGRSIPIASSRATTRAIRTTGRSAHAVETLEQGLLWRKPARW